MYHSFFEVCLSYLSPNSLLTGVTLRFLDLPLKIRGNEHIYWSGNYRPTLNGHGVYPRPLQNPLPIWIGVGGTPESFIRAGLLGLPLMVAIIGGETHRFRPLIDLYRQAGRRAHISRLAMVYVIRGYYFIKYCFILGIVCFKVALNNSLIHFNLGHCVVSIHR
jgi:alkanesulfonate monooxygenase SsuD/methylene tetrahydromethanopterin reductase-like flavin-dependent oxidoreductase (luciferase family)